ASATWPCSTAPARNSARSCFRAADRHAAEPRNPGFCLCVPHRRRRLCGFRRPRERRHPAGGEELHRHPAGIAGRLAGTRKRQGADPGPPGHGAGP
ncbi:hypothetical protein B8W90_12030, partial [Staphylococcus hominis]